MWWTNGLVVLVCLIGLAGSCLRLANALCHREAGGLLFFYDIAGYALLLGAVAVLTGLWRPPHLPGLLADALALGAALLGMTLLIRSRALRGAV